MAPVATTAVNDTSNFQLDRIVERSKRSSGLQLPLGFAADKKDSDPPLARMLRGGHGGEVRLKLFLTLALLATKSPYTIKPIAARTWAEALALHDPDGKGARRISDGLGWLAGDQNKFVRLDRVPGAPPTIHLLSALGTGNAWERPTAPYITLPLAYWSKRWVWKLTGSATAVLILILDEQARRTRQAKRSKYSVPGGGLLPASFTGHDRRVRGLSDDTWTRATKELVENGLLEVDRSSRGGDELDWRRSRKSYAVKHADFPG